MPTRKCLAPFFIGHLEPGLEKDTGKFDLVLPRSLVEPDPGSMAAIARVNLSIRDFVAKTGLAGDRPLVLCGDCLSAIGCLAGIRKVQTRPSYLLWFDAHGDFHTQETTLSGHLGGMPLAMITGRGDQTLLSQVDLSPIPDECVFHIGARDLEKGESDLMAKSGIAKANALGEVLGKIPTGSDVWVHFDTDYINPADAPAMRYPAIGGPRAEEVRREFEDLVREFVVIGVSVSAWAPHLDIDCFGTSTQKVCWESVSVLCFSEDGADRN